MQNKYYRSGSTINTNASAASNAATTTSTASAAVASTPNTSTANTSQMLANGPTRRILVSLNNSNSPTSASNNATNDGIQPQSTIFSHHTGLPIPSNHHHHHHHQNHNHHNQPQYQASQQASPYLTIRAASPLATLQKLTQLYANHINALKNQQKSDKTSYDKDIAQSIKLDLGKF